MSSLVGLWLVVVQGVTCCTSENSAKHACQSPCTSRRREFLVGLTICSAWPFVAEWKGMERMWWIPLVVMKSQNAPKVKAVLFSETRVSGSPWVENSFLRA